MFWFVDVVIASLWMLFDVGILVFWFVELGRLLLLL